MKKLLFMFLMILMFSFSGYGEEENNITVLKQYVNKPYTEMVNLLGPPADKTGYTIKNAPIKTWNHRELFSRYPKTSENEKVFIMEVTWDAGEFMIMACFHMVDGENRCLVAKRIKKGVKF
jgi:hypothetical protein